MRRFLLLLACASIWGVNAQTKNSSSQTVKPLLIPPPVGGGAKITGPTTVTYGQICNYGFPYAYPNITWSVSNGTISSSTSTSATVSWGSGSSGSGGTVVMINDNSPVSFALGGPNITMPISTAYSTSQLITGTICAYSNGTLEASLDVTINIPAIVPGSISPDQQTVLYNTAPTSLTYSGASGGTGTAFSYQWQYSSDNLAWTNIAGATGLTYNPGVLQTTNNHYRVQISQGATQTYSPQASITTVLTNSPPPLNSNNNGSDTIIDLTKAVGSPKGNVSGNSIGGINYSVPIDVLPGTNGLQPNISLVYNSHQGAGIAGWGWNLSCLSMIRRTGKSYYYDSLTSPVTYTNANDVFVLDGQRLFPISGSNGADGTIYGKEREDFSKIISFGGTETSGPDWFQVKMKDGTIMEYGRANNSKFQPSSTSTLIWLLNKVIDKNGNYCSFSYHIDPNQHGYALAEIDYTGNSNAGLMPYNKVLFNYSLKSDAQNSQKYIAGTTVATPYLLDTISILNASGVTVRSYICSYHLLHNEYFLRTLAETGADGTQLNPLKFTYGSNTATPFVTLSPALSGLATSGSIYSGDFHGNGVAGVISANYTVDNNNITRYSGFSMFGNLGMNPDSPKLHQDYRENLNTTDTSTLYDVPNASRNRTDYNALTNDYDGDGFTDVLFTGFSDSSSEKKLKKIQINYTRLRANGTYSYDSTIIQAMPSISGLGTFNHISGTYIIPGDFDGDGSQDYILVLGNGVRSRFKAFFCSPHKGKYYVEIDDFGIGGEQNYELGYYAASVANAQVRPVDFDGDGKTDLMITNGSESDILTINNSGTPSNYQLYASNVFSTSSIIANLPIYEGDFNGDGKTDFLVRSTPEDGNNSLPDHTGMYGGWNIYYSTGKYLNSYPFAFAKAPALDSDGYSNTHLLMVADINGDGRTDIWQSLDFIDSRTGVLRSMHDAYYSNGVPTGFDAQSAFELLIDTTETSINSDENKDPILGDFNGDGRTDIMTLQGNNARFVYPMPEREDHYMTKIVNGLGAESDISYSRLNKELVYNKSNPSYINNNYNIIEGPLYVVNQITSPNGIGGLTSYNYHYTDAAYNPIRGFLGFKQVQMTNSATGIKYFSISDINSSFLVAILKKQYTLDQSNDTLNEHDISDTLVAEKATATDKRFIYQISRSVDINGLMGTAVEIDNTYDTYGNITKSVTKTGALSGMTVASPIETATTTTTFGVHNTSVAALPESITYSNTRSGQAAVTKHSTYTYDPLGNTLVTTHFSGTAKAVSTTYSYDNFGNETQEVIASSGVNSRTLQNTYDSQGRFVILKKQMGSGIIKKEAYSYNDWGNVLNKTSTSGLTTTYIYNGFGGLTKSTLPEGYSISYTYAWESTYGRYSVTSSQPGGGTNKKTWYDIMDRAIQTQSSGFNSQNMTQNVVYNTKGQLVSSTNHHYSNESAVTTTFTYDETGRVTKISKPNKYVSYSFSKLSGGQYKVTTINSAGQTSSKTIDATNQVIAATDNGGTLNYTYDSWGNLLKTMMGGKTLITNIFDIYGRLTSMTDLNTGAYAYSYDAFGQLTKQTDPMGHSYTLNYDDFGRLVSRVGPEGTTSYSYYNNTATGYNDNHVIKVTGFSGEETDYTYDALMRVKTKKVTVDGLNNTTSFAYDTYGNLIKRTYSDGVVVNSIYNRNAVLISETLQDGSTGTARTIFTASAINSAGIYTGYTLGNGKSSQVNYDIAMGRPTRYYTPGIQDLNFSFDSNTGNLTSRKDAIHNLSETFTFDNLNRLTGSKVNNVQQLVIKYDNSSGTSFGNITQKSDAGKYVYNTNKINAVAYITDTSINQTLPPPNISQSEQKIGYTPFLMTDSVAENGTVVHYTYSAGYARIKSVLKVNGVTTETKYYLGAYEKQIKGSTTRYIHYISAGNVLYAIAVKENGGAVKVFYAYTDYLGSILAVTDSSGSVVARQNYDAWGRHRNPDNWTYTNVPTAPDWLYRGYTGHEELSQFGLINMNGRMYDPVQGRMLAPDKIVANIWSSQAYNRFTYAMNNPLMFTDPTGFLAIPIQQPLDGDIWTGGYNGGDANILPTVVVGGDGGASLPTTTDPGYMFGGYSPFPPPGSDPINHGDVPTGPQPHGGGGGSNVSYSGSEHQHLTASPVNTNGNVKEYNDIQATNKTLDALEKSVGSAADTHTTAIGVVRVLTNADKALQTLSRTGTVIGAVAGGIPAAVNIGIDLYNGNAPSGTDLINLGVAVGGLIVEFSGAGELYDGAVGLGYAGLSLANDIWNFFK